MDFFKLSSFYNKCSSYLGTEKSYKLKTVQEISHAKRFYCPNYDILQVLQHKPRQRRTHDFDPEHKSTKELYCNIPYFFRGHTNRGYIFISRYKAVIRSFLSSSGQLCQFSAHYIHNLKIGAVIMSSM